VSKKECANECEACGKDKDELFSTFNFKLIHGVEFVCYNCFVKLHGVVFEEYKREEEV
jgi:hypothetical protein